MVFSLRSRGESWCCNCPTKTKNARPFGARRDGRGMPLRPFKVNFGSQVADLTHELERQSRGGVFPGENPGGLLILDSRTVYYPWRWDTISRVADPSDLR